MINPSLQARFLQAQIGWYKRPDTCWYHPKPCGGSQDRTSHSHRVRRLPHSIITTDHTINPNKLHNTVIEARHHNCCPLILLVALWTNLKFPCCHSTYCPPSFRLVEVRP